MAHVADGEVDMPNPPNPAAAQADDRESELSLASMLRRLADLAHDMAFRTECSAIIFAQYGNHNLAAMYREHAQALEVWGLDLHRALDSAPDCNWTLTDPQLTQSLEVFNGLSQQRNDRATDRPASAGQPE
jgi:hypothetical protein